MSGKSHTEYFPGIDGLRAIAVLSVLLFHLNGLLPSGFVGVDIFFVISGFVVASAAVDLPSNNFRSFLAAFYVRRLVRIVPALAVCLMVSMLLMALFVPLAPDGRLTEANTKTGLAAFLGISNIVLAGSAGDYWSPRSELNPFTHTWSLGVEEQFYLLFPFLYFMWLRGARRGAAVLLAVAMAGSVLVAALWTGKTTLAFYSLASRFWELGLGVALFFCRGRWRPWLAATSSFHTPLGVLVAASLVVSLLWTDGQQFPWPSALIPVVATALAIALVVACPQSWLGRMLAAKPLVAIGKVSYSLYLWHWPVIVLGRWTVGMESVPELLLALVLTLALAVASYRWIEQPVRRAKVVRSASRPRILAIAFCGLGVSVSIAVGVALARPTISRSVSSDPLVWRWDGTTPPDETGCRTVRSTSALGSGRVFELTPVGCKSSPRRLYVAGDSHAGAYLAMFDRYSRERGVAVRLFTKPGCGVYPLRTAQSSSAADCQQFVRDVLRDVSGTAKAGDILFLPGLRVPRYADQWGVDPRQASTPLSDDTRKVVEEAATQLLPLATSGVRVLFEAPKPVFKAPPFRCSDVFNHTNPVCEPGFEIPRAEVTARRAAVMEKMTMVVQQLPHASIWDPLPVLCPSITCSAYEAVSGQPLFFDGDHVSGFGNQRLWASFDETIGSLR